MSPPAGEVKSLVDLVIPVYNEAHVLEHSVTRLTEAMRNNDCCRWRILIVDNGSIDGTDRVAAKLAASRDEVETIHLEEKGRGRALRAAWSRSHAEFSIYLDVDLSTHLRAVPETVELLASGADLVTGSRLHSESRIVRCVKREVLSRVYNRLVRWTLGTRSFDDCQCGFKGVRIETIRPLLPLVKNQNWFFDTELLTVAEYAGLVVRSIPIEWTEDPDTRVNIASTVWEDLKGLARLRRTAKALVQNWQNGREPHRDRS